MKLNLCTVSFRNELTDIGELARFAAPLGFHGIEIWGVHALALSRSQARLEGVRDVIRSHGLAVPVISSYLDPLCDPQRLADQSEIAEELIRAANVWDVPLLRVFAGNLASRSASRSVWETCVARLKLWTRRFADEGISLIVETHPQTLADSLASTLRLIEEVDEPSLKINLDFLHIWEYGDDVFEAFEALQDRIGMFHLKNVRSKEDLDVFSPSNVFSPRRNSAGLVPLAGGAIDYASILKVLEDRAVEVSMSLEWFGEDPFRVLAEEIAWIRTPSSRRLQFDAV